jgi:hypothetical protein
MTTSIDYDGVNFEIEYDFYPSEPRVYNYGDGSGYAGSEAQIDLHSIKINEYEVYDVLQESVIDKLYDLLIEIHNE